MIAKHVVEQLVPDWRKKVVSDDKEEEVLLGILKEFFKFSKDCRIQDDLCLFKLAHDKKIAFEVQGLRNLPKLGTLQ